MQDQPDLEAVKSYLLELQERICAALEGEEGEAGFREDNWERDEGGGGRSRVLEGGSVFEKAGINFSHVQGASLPASATAARPQLAGRGFQAIIRPASFTMVSDGSSVALWKRRWIRWIWCVRSYARPNALRPTFSRSVNILSVSASLVEED